MLLALALGVEREWALRSAAGLWIISDPVGPADAVAVLGGGVEVRPFEAARYYREGLVKKVLLPNLADGPAELLGALPTHTEANRNVLVRLGVSPTAIEIFGSSVRNTHDEAVALRDWAERSDAHSIIVPTEIFSTRRVKWVMRAVFANSAVISVPALDAQGYRRDDWWRHEGGLMAFQNEIMKYAYYRFKY
jgi:uncharacterized SAM-binding protein YcdF (DUF218 family)